MPTDKPLLIMSVFFGPLPPWLPLTLHSMAANSKVDFVVVGDAPPPAIVPPNVRFERVSYQQMQQNLATITGRSVKYTNTYKANDIKPLLPALYPSAFMGYEWWGWADLDVVFGDLLKFLALAEPHPACCKGLEVNCNKAARRDRSSVCYNSSRPRVAADTYGNRKACACTNGEVVTAISPLYPNPWRKKCWGPFTLFRGSIQSQHGWRLFEESPKWREVVETHEYTHFDEWWGPFVQRGYETMGDVMTRLSDEGRLVMSRTWLPFSEAKSCVDIECTFCPCGATRMRIDGKTLTVNDEESMVLHLGESKQNWARAAAQLAGGGGVRWSAEQSFGSVSAASAIAAASVSEGPWALPAYTRDAEARGVCYDVLHLGGLGADASLAHVGGAAVAATRYARHRPASSKASATIVYYARNGSGVALSTPQLRVRRCDEVADSTTDAAAVLAGGVGGGGFGGAAATATGGGSDSAETLSRARAALTQLAAQYEAFTAGERARTLEWLCAWQRLSAAYMESISLVDLESKLSRNLPEIHGNRRVRTPMYGGERVGWWRQTVNMSESGARGGPCHPPEPMCPPVSGSALLGRRKWPDLDRIGSKGGGRGRRRAAVSPGQSPGRLLRAVKAKPKRVSRYDLNTPPVPGVPCLPDPGSAGASLEELRDLIFASYLQLQHARRAEKGRHQRWMCSWLYKLRACDDAERAQRAQPVPLGQGRCRRIEPPEQGAADAGLGWRGHRVNAMADLSPLLFAFRCW